MHDKIIARVKILLKIMSDDIKFEAQSICIFLYTGTCSEKQPAI